MQWFFADRWRAPTGTHVRARGGERGERGESALGAGHCIAAPLAEAEDYGVGRSLKRGGFSPSGKVVKTILEKFTLNFA
jgi:hypothetical protein